MSQDETIEREIALLEHAEAVRLDLRGRARATYIRRMPDEACPEAAQYADPRVADLVAAEAVIMRSSFMTNVPAVEMVRNSPRGKDTALEDLGRHM